MSGLFCEIFEAIRYLRQEKGTSEKAILMYVREKLGKCMSTGKVLKTIRTIDRLVDEGRLIRKGRRIMLPFPDQKEQDAEGKGDAEEEGNEDCEDEEDEDDEDNECEDEDEEDDEDEDEDEDDDDDDDGTCSNYNTNTTSKTGNGTGNGNNSCPSRNSPVKMNEDAEWSNKYVNNKMKTYAKSELNPLKRSFARKKLGCRDQICTEAFDEDAACGNSDDVAMMDVEDLPGFEGGGRTDDVALSLGYFGGTDRSHASSPGEQGREYCSEESKGEPLIKVEQESSKDSLRKGKERVVRRRDRETVDRMKAEKMSRLDETETKQKKESSHCPSCKKKRPPGSKEC